MSRTVYLNGEYLPEAEAKISIFDRSVNFGDALYEVAGVLNGQLIDFEHHMQRYYKNLGELNIPSPLTKKDIHSIFKKLVSDNNLSEGLVYFQTTRGIADRDYVYQEGMEPTVFMFTQEKTPAELVANEQGIKLLSVPDIRWARRDIKSVNLLGQVLAKQQAHEAGFDEALMLDPDGFVTECGSCSFYIIKDRKILTRQLNRDILPGVTRRAIFALCEQHNFDLLETRFSLADLKEADEAFITAASAYVQPVVTVDSHQIGSGSPGEITRKLQKLYREYVITTLS